MKDTKEKIEKVLFEGEILAIVVHSDSLEGPLNFFSPETFSLQAAMQNRDAGAVVEAHEHFPIQNIASLYCQEIFFVLSGKMLVGLYKNQKRVEERILNSGDIIILNCGHDVKFLEKTTMFEVRNGPYRGKEFDKRYIK